MLRKRAVFGVGCVSIEIVLYWFKSKGNNYKLGIQDVLNNLLANQCPAYS
jgi:hypothetical protein